METASEIYIAYVRPHMWLVFLAGFAVVIFGNAEKWKTYDRAQMIPRWKNGLPNPEYFREAGIASIRAIWPIWMWMLMFGIPATIIDAVLGPK
jgi:hypothetical protein